MDEQPENALVPKVEIVPTVGLSIFLQSIKASAPIDAAPVKSKDCSKFIQPLYVPSGTVLEGQVVGCYIDVKDSQFAKALFAELEYKTKSFFKVIEGTFLQPSKVYP